MGKIKQIGNIPIAKRTFNDYHGMSHGLMSSKDMKAYNDIQNSDEFTLFVNKYFSNFPLTIGAKAVISHFEKHSINSEKAEFMSELPVVDSYILFKTGEVKITGVNPDDIIIDDVPPISN